MLRTAPQGGCAGGGSCCGRNDSGLSCLGRAHLGMHSPLSSAETRCLSLRHAQHTEILFNSFFWRLFASVIAAEIFKVKM